MGAFATDDGVPERAGLLSAAGIAPVVPIDAGASHRGPDCLTAADAKVLPRSICAKQVVN